MDLLLLAIALTILLGAGAGVALLLRPKAGGVDLLGLSFLLGAAVVSMAMFITGLLLPVGSLRGAVTAVCLGIGLWSLWGLWRRRGESRRFGRVAWPWYALSAVSTSLISWRAFRTSLGWDGMLVFEIKARLAFLNGGVVPAGYFLDPLRAWSHPDYPLLLPLTETWLYLWLGRPDQQRVKILFPMFFAAALAMLFTASRQAGGDESRRPEENEITCRFNCFLPSRRLDWLRFHACVPVSLLLMMSAPFVWTDNGSAAISGYADFPLAVYYLAAIVALLEYRRMDNGRDLLLAGGLLACACWLKREGAILWIVAAALGLMDWKLRRVNRGWLRLAGLLVPGLLVLLLWRLFIRWMGVELNVDFLPIGVAALKANAHHAPALLRYMLGELTHVHRWGIFWPLSIGAAMYLILFRREFILPVAVLGPVLAYSCLFFFSKWEAPVVHAASAYPRLLLHVVPVAAVTIASLAGRKDRKKDAP